MNMKKFLLISLAALGFAACEQQIEGPESPTHNGEVEESYIAINLMSADKNSTRAITDDPYGNADQYGYEDGTDAERAIKTAYFFFFDADGQPFNVVNAPATTPGGTKNHLSLTIGNTTGEVDPNVSDIKEAVLILNTYKGVYPSKIVAVLNWTPSDKAYTLNELHELLAVIGNDANGYVMSNSVYMDGAGNMVDAVPLTAANIKTSSQDALDNPVDIYVERTAAKVVLTASKKIAGTDNIFDTQKNSTSILTAGTGIDVYVKLHGWELYNDYNTTNLLKNIQNWDIATLGLTWNDIPYYRCYWAESQAEKHNDEFAWKYETPQQNTKGFPTEYGFSVAESANYAPGTYTYCGENTNGEELRTKVILKGQLMQQVINEGVTSYEPLELARWYGTEYAGEEALRTAVANSLKYTLYYKEAENKYVGITPEDLQCVAGTLLGNKEYEVGFQLSDLEGKGKNREWFQYDSENGYVSLGAFDTEGNNAINTNEYLKSVEPALLYAEGQTYYYIDIKHLGAPRTTTEYGVVRNHVYQIDVESITGYGSPVYIGTSNIVTPPDYPLEDESSYVAARINVLSWKVVKQGVNVGQ